MNRRSFFAAAAGLWAWATGRKALYASRTGPAEDYAYEQNDPLLARCRPVFHRVASHILCEKTWVYCWRVAGQAMVIECVFGHNPQIKAYFDESELEGLDNYDLTHFVDERFRFETRILNS
jgi:hypothetical protein